MSEIKEIVLPKIFSKEFKGPKGTFVRYSINVKDQWFTLKGIGVEQLKEGDTIHATYNKKQYQKKDGTSGEEKIFTLIDPALNELYKMVKAIYSAVVPQTGSKEAKTTPQRTDHPY